MQETDEAKAFASVWSRVTGKPPQPGPPAPPPGPVPPAHPREPLTELIAALEEDEACLRAAAAHSGRSRAGALFGSLAAEDRRLLRALRARRYLAAGMSGRRPLPPPPPWLGPLHALRAAYLRREKLARRLAEAAKDSGSRTAALLRNASARAEEGLGRIAALLEAMMD